MQTGAGAEWDDRTQSQRKAEHCGQRGQQRLLPHTKRKTRDNLQ